MKQISTSMVALTMLAAWLFVMPVGELAAAGLQSGPAPTEGEVSMMLWSGPFGGYDKDAGRIWINDRVFRYNDQLKVMGTGSKVGLLSEIKGGEKVDILAERGDGSKIPLAVVIRRY